MFFRKPPFGLDISDYSIEAISLTGPYTNPKLLAMGRTILEQGIVEDGKILKKERLKNSLQGFLKDLKFGKIKTDRFIFVLPESRCFIHILELPENLKKPEISEFIKLQANQVFPYSPKELYSDFQIQNKEALLIATPKKIINDYLEIFRDLGLRPLVFENESSSLARAFILEEKEPVLIADIGARTTNFSVFDDNRLRLSISLSVAGNKLTQALSEKLNISREKAENLKKEIGLNPKLQKGKVFLILQKEIYNIIKEVNKILDYFQKKEKKEIKKIILAGGSANLPGLKEYLDQNLQRPVIIGAPWVKINIDVLKKKEYYQKALKINPLLYSTAIGSALRGLIKKPEEAGINLLPKGRLILKER